MSWRWALWLACLASGLSALALGEPTAVVPSPVYVQAAPHPRFKHGSTAHAAEPCARCHVPGNAGSGAESLQPQEASCGPCHAAALDRANPSSASCATCHEGYGAGSGAATLVPVWPRTRAELRFSHATHAARGVACNRCHGGPEHRELPTMAACLDCHRSAESRRCSTCHPTLPDGKLRTRLPDGAVLLPRSSFLGMQHDSDWGVRHRWVAADQSSTCQSCHAERDCRRCHDGRTPPPSIHPNDFLSLHAQDARREPARCARCHSAQTFCMECHARLGVALNSPPDLRGTTRFHPPAAEWSRGPVRHAVEARRALSACVSCHAESDCVQCHGATGVGGAGVSPHPKAFFERCGRALRSNPRACRGCHGNLDALQARCP
jgi:hypothetical protein